MNEGRMKRRMRFEKEKEGREGGTMGR